MTCTASKHDQRRRAQTTTIASAAKNSFAGAVAQGGAGPEDYVPHLTDFVAQANGVE
jgi:hypothetical protein